MTLLDFFAKPDSIDIDAIAKYLDGLDSVRRIEETRTLGSKHQPRLWEAAKGFDDAAPISAIRPWSGAPPQGRISLSVNGQTRQDAKVADMLWNVPEIISEASKLWRLKAGDLIYTGTPEGVGPLARGDQVEGEVEGVGRLAFRMA